MKITSGEKLISEIDKYVEECRLFSENDKNDKKKPIFANVAGFCRFAGISVPQFLALRKKFSPEFEAAGAYFEDAALNSGATASLVGMYLRQYGFWGQATESEVNCEHDLYSDGI